MLISVCLWILISKLSNSVFFILDLTSLYELLKISKIETSFPSLIWFVVNINPLTSNNLTMENEKIIIKIDHIFVGDFAKILGLSI